MTRKMTHYAIASTLIYLVTAAVLYASPTNRIQNHDFQQGESHWTYHTRPSTKPINDQAASNGKILQVGRPVGQHVNEKEVGYFSGACQFIDPVPSAGSDWTISAIAKLTRHRGKNTTHAANVSIEYHLADGTTQLAKLLTFDQDNNTYTKKSSTFTVPGNVEQARIWLRMPIDTKGGYNTTQWSMDVDRITLVSNTLSDVVVPSAPSPISLGARTISVNWPKVAQATAYRLIRKDTNNITRSVIIDAPHGNPANNYIDYTVKPQHTYTYSVTALTDSSESTPSAASTVTTPALTPSLGHTTYYLDSSIGDDNNSGLTNEKPWKSLHKISSIKFSPGDQILLKRGSYWAGNIILTGSGTSDNPIIFSAYGQGSRPILAGKGINNAMGTITLMNASHWTFSDLEVSNKGRRRGLYAAILGVAEEGKGDQRGIIIRNNYFHDVNCVATKTREPRAAIAFNAKSLTGKRDIPDEHVTRFHDILVENNRFHRCDIQGVGLYSDFRKHPRLHHEINHTNIVIRGNYLVDSTNDAFSFGVCSDSLAEYNIVHKIGIGRIHDNAGITTFRSVNCTSQYNVVGDIYGFSGQAFDFDHATINCTVQYNLSYNNHAGIVTMLSGDSHGDILRYNISHNDVLFPGGNNVPIRSIDYDKTFSYTTGVYNNTIYISKSDRIGELNPETLQSQSDNALFYNNLMFYDDGVIGETNQARRGDFKSNSFFGAGSANKIYDSVHDGNHVFSDLDTIRKLPKLLDNIYQTTGLTDPSQTVNGKNIYLTHIKPLLASYTPATGTFDTLDQAIAADNRLTTGGTPIKPIYARNNSKDLLGNTLHPSSISRGAVNVPVYDLAAQKNVTIHFSQSQSQPLVRIYDQSRKFITEFSASDHDAFTWDAKLTKKTKLPNGTYRAIIETVSDAKKQYQVKDFVIMNANP
ncbi:hypothetical protein [Poriferisphaera sp. WC338]|uniref:hypothetical protein n=1 Tax=Poriferisphaera sp. WC338 TaxID=3425129 RepID=UPI003D815EFA